MCTRLALFSALFALLLLASAQAKVVSFGWNAEYQLGLGLNTTTIKVPVNCVVTSGISVKSVGLGDKHVLFISSSDAAWAYGYNVYGQLGFGNTSCPIESIAPPQCPNAGPVLTDGVLSGQAVKAVAGGETFSLVLTESGNVTSFGYNYYGQLGDGTTTNRHSPVAVSIGEISAIAAGRYHSLALSTSGKVFSWGQNSWSQMGDGTTTERNAPVSVVDTLMNSTITAIAAGYYHSVALDSNGKVWAWGGNTNGQLGDGTTTERSSPVEVNTTAVAGTITAIAAGSYHTLLLTDAGAVYSMGLNSDGQLGDGTSTDSYVPKPVVTSGVLNGVTITAISAGYDHSLALSDAGKAYAWGSATYGQLGNNGDTDETSPVEVYTGAGALKGVKVLSIHASDYFSVVTAEDGDPVPDSASAACSSLLMAIALVIAAMALLL